MNVKCQAFSLKKNFGSSVYFSKISYHMVSEMYLLAAEYSWMIETAEWENLMGSDIKVRDIGEKNIFF